MIFANARTWTRLLLRAAPLLLIVCVALLLPVMVGGRAIPRGPQLVYMSDKRGNWDIYLYDWNYRLTRRLTDADVDDRFPMWSPDGTLIGYHSGVFSTDNPFDLTVMDADGENARMLPVSARFRMSHQAMMSWSPDMQYITFHSDAGGYWNAYLSDAEGEAAYKITDSPGDEVRVAWSPDGKWIAFGASQQSGTERDIYLLNLREVQYYPGAGNVYARRLTDSLESDWDPVFSPDGSQILFTSMRDFNSEIYVMDFYGRDQRNLTNTQTVNEQQAIWLPDGQRILFSADRYGSDDLFLIDLRTGQTRRITFDSTANEQVPSLWWPGTGQR